MSFFGFDPSGPPGKSKHKNNKNFKKNNKNNSSNSNNNNNNNGNNDDLDTYDFEETYDGLGDNYIEEEDAFNDETFGTEAGANLGKDFDFTGGLKPSNTNPVNDSGLSYAQAANVSDILQPMASLWVDDSNQQQQQPQVQEQPQTQQPEKKILSLEEIEAKLRQQPEQQQQQIPMQQQQQQIPPQYMFPPQLQQILNAAVASGQFPNFQAAAQALSQGFMPFPPPPPPPHFQNNNGMAAPPTVPFNQQFPSQFPPQLQQQQIPQQQVQQQPQQPQQSQAQQQPQVQQQQQQHSIPPMNDLPVLGATEENKQSEESQATQQQYNKFVSPSPQQQNRQLNQINNNNNNHHHNNNNNNHHYQQLSQQQQLENMTPEEREKFLKRQQKVSKITRCSGFMNPRDKDFVTRFQLSQIVTEDPYNEDFYCQVYKLLNSNANENNISSIAQKYLEQSGHRLGGRSKRADVALQRMQQQVSKAVTVAKERGKRTGVFSKEGALGKVSFGTGRQPRKQLVLSSNENPEEGDTEGETRDDGDEIEEASNEQETSDSKKSKSGSDELKDLIQKKSTGTAAADATTAKQEQDNEVTVPKEYIFSKSSRSFQLSIIEDIYSQVLKLESLERENQEINSNDLWKCLHINDKIQTSEGEINPFISVLSFDKSMKVFNRLFHFLTNEQKFKIVELIFINLQKLDIVLKGSYKNYISENYNIPKKYLNKIELFQMTIMKTLVLYISESKFLNVLSLLNSVIINNNILFLSTTKIGLSLITILVSRLELIKQELNKNLSAHDLSSWLLIYDKLFQGLEGRLNQIFPPYLSCDENKSVINQLSIDDDDSYIWQFLASLSLAGLLNHQRIIVDEIRNEIFGVMNKAKVSKQNNDINNYNKLLNNLNLFLNVMGLKANENDIGELS